MIDLVRSFEVPIMKNALVEKYILYSKRDEDIISDYFAGKKKKTRIKSAIILAVKMMEAKNT